MPIRKIIFSREHLERILGTARQMAENEKRIAEREAAAICGALNLSSGETMAAIYGASNLNPGDRMPDGTIYVGQYKPKDRDGNSLRKTFNVFAAPEDLPQVMKYDDTVKHIAGLKKWHGYNGTNYATDKEFYAAVKDGSYNGGWIIPTCDILIGNDVDGKATTPNNLYAHKNTGGLTGTFKDRAWRGYDTPHWYWSSTERRRDLPRARSVRFSDGNEDWDHKDYFCFSCRPVRLVPIG
jgi:hypothetical protein